MAAACTTTAHRLGGRVYLNAERFLERMTDAFIFVSQFEADAYVAKVGKLTRPAVVVRNGLRPEEFERIVPVKDPRDFLFIGTLRDLKGPDVFIDALAAVQPRSGIPPTAWIVGAGDDKPKYEAQVGSLRLGDRVVFRDPMPAREAFRLARAVVVPSRAESMPYIVLETIAAGMPLIATRVGGIPEILGPEDNRLVPPGDSSALAAAMTSVLNEPGLAQATALGLREQIRNSFSVDAMAESITKVYRSVTMPRNYLAQARNFLQIPDISAKLCLPSWPRQEAAMRLRDTSMNQLSDTLRCRDGAAPVNLPPEQIVYGALSQEALKAAASLSRHAMSRVLVSGFARLIEFGAGVLTGLAIYLIYVEPEKGLDLWYAVPLLGGPLFTVLAVQLAGGYAVPALRGTGPQIGRVHLAWTLVFALMAVAAFIAKVGEEFSRVWFVAWYFAGLASFTVFRVVLASAVRRWTREGLLERRAVIVGGGPAAEQLIRALEAEPSNDIHICGIFDDRKDHRSPSSVAGYPKLGTVAELVQFGRVARVDLLIVSLPLTAENRLLQVLKQLWILPVDIRLSAHTNKLRFRPRTYSFVGKVPFLDVVDKPIADWDVVTKWLVDRVLGAVLLALVTPIMALTALAIRLDSKGPVLFKQKRYGFNNELIEVYKFRSMYTDMTDANASKLVTRGDARVTRVGRFIRKTSLDELPQLFNVVFKSNLSLVGPRPHAIQAKAANQLYNDVVDSYFARHRVKPGITGWAQINGWRGETDTEEKIQNRVEHDLYYIENWTVLLDLYIIFITPFRLLSTESAY